MADEGNHKMKQAGEMQSETIAALNVKVERGGKAKAAAKGKIAKESGAFIITYKVSEQTHLQLKLHAAKKRTSMQELLDEALDDYFAKESLPALLKVPAGGKKKGVP